MTSSAGLFYAFPGRLSDNACRHVKLLLDGDFGDFHTLILTSSLPTLIHRIFTQGSQEEICLGILALSYPKFKVGWNVRLWNTTAPLLCAECLDDPMLDPLLILPPGRPQREKQD
jgi:hypothetical protein